ncbi:cysteine-rich repeat secretory protein 38-like [Nymphaea colorata]|nr:cysteine-rich repeat secretory protein 38-like [Nymphaea colorata]
MEIVYSVMVPTLLRVGFLLLLLLSFHVDLGMSTNDYIDSRCNVTANYTGGSKFEWNMHGVFTILTKDAPPSGFANVTKGKGLERVLAVASIDTYCPNAIDAIMWYENCQPCYSNTNFFARLNVEDSGSWYWTADKVEEPKAFNQKLGSLLKNLTSQATTEPNSKFMFVTGNITSTDQKTIYGLVQCTRDTTLADCSQCLISTISQIPSTCENAHGCEIATGSWRVMFDTQLFYNSTTTPSLTSIKFKPKTIPTAQFTTPIKFKPKPISSA